MIKAVIFDMFETLITHYKSPLYFGAQMAQDAGISEAKFQALWRPTEYERTVGKQTLEQVVEYILVDNQCYSQELLNIIVNKRKAAKVECFNHLHTQIIPMLQELQTRGLKIGLISNCFSEEVVAIRNSALFPYFDAPVLSYEHGVQKPDKEIFNICLDMLHVKADECLYVGDGGSLELEMATELGMKAVQATWYHPVEIKKEFQQMKEPLEIISIINM